MSDAGEVSSKGIHIKGLPMRSSDTSIRDGLFHQYKKYGKAVVNVFGAAEERYAIITFKKEEDAIKALEESKGKVFFGSEIIVTKHDGLEIAEDPEDDLTDKERDEYHPKATRALFVGNLPKDVSMAKLKEVFGAFGDIINIEMKTPGMTSAYAFIQYESIGDVVRALKEMDGKSLGDIPLKLGFGKCTPTTCVWLNNIPETITQKFLAQNFGRYGPVMHSVVDRVKQRALIYFDGVDFSQTAVNEMRGRTLNGNKIQIDFASRDFQTVFYEHMEKTEQLKPGDKPDDKLLRQFQGGNPNRPAGFDGPGGSSSGGDPPPFRGGGGRGGSFGGRGGGGRGGGPGFFGPPGGGGPPPPFAGRQRTHSTGGAGYDHFESVPKSYPKYKEGADTGYSDQARAYMENKYMDMNLAYKRYQQARDLSRYEDTYHPGMGGYSFRRKAPGERLCEQARPEYDQVRRRSPSPMGMPPMRPDRYGSPPPPRSRDFYERMERRPEADPRQMRYRDMDSPPPMRYRSRSPLPPRGYDAPPPPRSSRYMDDGPPPSRSSKYADDPPPRAGKYDEPPRGYSDSYMKRYMGAGEKPPRGARAYSPMGSASPPPPARRARSPASPSRMPASYRTSSRGYPAEPAPAYGDREPRYERHEKRRKVYD